MTDDVIDRIWKLADRIDPCLLSTLDEETPRVRPCYARARRDEGRIYILTDVSGEKHAQIEAHPRVALAFADIRANDYAVIYGRATVSRDRAKIAEVWSTKDESFWETPDNPDLLLITVDPEEAELWDGSNLLVTGAKVLAERLVGAEVELVENRKISQI